MACTARSSQPQEDLGAGEAGQKKERLSENELDIFKRETSRAEGAEQNTEWCKIETETGRDEST